MLILMRDMWNEDIFAPKLQYPYFISHQHLVQTFWKPEAYLLWDSYSHTVVQFKIWPGKYLKTIMLWVKLVNTYRVDNLSGGLYSSLSDVLPSHYTWRSKWLSSESVSQAKLTWMVQILFYIISEHLSRKKTWFLNIEILLHILGFSLMAIISLNGLSL